MLSDVSSKVDAHTHQQLRDVRRHLWTGGWKGMAYGFLGGVIAFGMARVIPAYRKKATMTNAVVGVLGFSALCGYIGSVTDGRNASSYAAHAIRHSPEKLARPEPDEQTSNTSPLGYRAHELRKERDVLREQDEAFARRAEAIRRAKEAKEAPFPPFGGDQPRW